MSSFIGFTDTLHFDEERATVVREVSNIGISVVRSFFVSVDIDCWELEP